MTGQRRSGPHPFVWLLLIAAVGAITWTLLGPPEVRGQTPPPVSTPDLGPVTQLPRTPPGPPFFAPTVTPQPTPSLSSAHVHYDLVVDKTAAQPGDELLYGAYVKNPSGEVIEDLVVTVSFENLGYKRDSTTFVRSDSGGGMLTPGAMPPGMEESWPRTGLSIGNLAPGQSVVIFFRAIVAGASMSGPDALANLGVTWSRGPFLVSPPARTRIG